MAVSSIGFPLRLKDVEPDDSVYRRSRAARAWFRSKAAEVALAYVRKRILQGRGADGGAIRPISDRTRHSRAEDISPFTGEHPYSPMGRANPNAPPLAPAGEKSRSVSLLRVAEQPGQVWLYWAYDPVSGIDWGRAMARHAAGFVVRFVDGWAKVPARNQLGFSPGDLSYLRAELGRLWYARRDVFDDAPAARGAPAPAAAPVASLGASRTPPASSRRGIFGGLKAAVGKAVDSIVGKLFGGFGHGA